MKLVSNFNERFKEAFGSRSVTEFAAEIGVSKQTISAYLNSSRKPKKIVAEKIAQHLNVSPAWLLGYEVPKTMKEPATETGDGLEIKLSDNDKIIIDLLMSLSDSKKVEAIRYLRYLAEQSDNQ